MIVECFAVFECVYCPYRNNVYGPALAHSGRMNPVAAIVSNDGEEHARTIDGYDSFAVKSPRATSRMSATIVFSPPSANLMVTACLPASGSTIILEAIALS